VPGTPVPQVFRIHSDAYGLNQKVKATDTDKILLKKQETALVLHIEPHSEAMRIVLNRTPKADRLCYVRTLKPVLAGNTRAPFDVRF